MFDFHKINAVGVNILSINRSCYGSNFRKIEETSFNSERLCNSQTRARSESDGEYNQITRNETLMLRSKPYVSSHLNQENGSPNCKDTHEKQKWRKKLQKVLRAPRYKSFINIALLNACLIFHMTIQ